MQARKGIDKKIKNAVLYSNLLGIPTTGSCEGHVNHGSPAPWIKVTTPFEPAGGKRLTDAYRRWQMKDREIRRRALKFLGEFYKGRNAPRDIRLVIKNANSGFWIHNGGDDYARWRKFVDKSVIKIKYGQKTKGIIDKEEQNRRVRKLPARQKEIASFAKFLKGKYIKVSKG